MPELATIFPFTGTFAHLCPRLAQKNWILWGHFKLIKRKKKKRQWAAIFQLENLWMHSLISHYPRCPPESSQDNLVNIGNDRYTNTLYRARAATSHDSKPTRWCQFHYLWGRWEQGRERSMPFLDSWLSLVLDPAVMLLKLLIFSEQRFL